MKAMILAAGKGERMLPLTANTPKPLLEVNGKSLIQHQIEKLAANGIKEIVINYSYLGEKIEQALGSGHDFGVSLTYSPETEPLETAGGIIQALPLLGKESFIIVNADIWTDYTFNNLQPLTGSECLAHLVMVENAAHYPGGDFVLRDDGILCSSKAPPEHTYTYSGIAVFHPNFFAGVEAGKRALRPLFEKIMAAGKLGGESFQGEWVDVGTPERLDALNQVQRE